MGNIGTERRVVEFEPLPEELVADPAAMPEPVPPTPPAPEPARQ